MSVDCLLEWLSAEPDPVWLSDVRAHRRWHLGRRSYRLRRSVPEPGMRGRSPTKSAALWLPNLRANVLVHDRRVDGGRRRWCATLKYGLLRFSW